MNILLVDDEPDILEILREFLELKQHDVTTATNGKQALDVVLSRDDLDLVFSDIKMPDMDGLTFLERVRDNNLNIPVILISGQGDLESSIRALKLGALDFIVKPVYLKAVDEALERIDTAIAVEQETLSAMAFVEQQSLTLRCDSKLSHIRRIISYFSKHTKDICASYGLDVNKVAICLQECLTNAIIHGNFEVESTMKEDDWSAFDALIKQREAEPGYGDKQVTVSFLHTPQKIEFRVVDEGSGFDPEELPDPTDPESWLKLSGRGILFIRSYMDSVEWNAIGNEIIISKYLT